MTQAAQDVDFNLFVSKLKAKTGIDLSQYKEQQMKRRLSHLRDSKGYKTFGEFFQAVSQDAKLCDQLLDHMTINVSEFFRNSKRWEVLAHKLVPELIARSGSIKCWSAACSTGDEPYTLAMLLMERLQRRQFQVLATDIDKSALKKAMAGIYPASSLREVPKAYRDRYFQAAGSSYAVADNVKSCVTFKQHNLLADAYDTQFDLIVCRNVLIYFTDEAKDGIFKRFSQSLKKGGYLFVGGTEQIFQPGMYDLESVDTFFYRKT